MVALGWVCVISMMSDQLIEHKECAIFPENEDTQANHQKWEDERASSFEYLSDYRKLRNHVTNLATLAVAR